MSEEKRAVLRRVRAFADLGDAECDVVLRVLRARRGAPGDTLFREGDPGTALMIVLEGQLVAHVGTEEVARLGPGEVVGEVAFVDAEPRSATVSAPGGATILEFTREALGELRRSAPRVAAAIQRNVLLDVARRLRDVGEKMAGPESSRGAAAAPSRAGRMLTSAQLRSLPALNDYVDEDIDLLAHIATLRTFAPGASLIHEGSEGDACFLVVAGEVVVSRAGQNVATLGVGALLGQLALLDRAPRSATVTATQDTAALEIRADAFTNLVRAHSPLALRFQSQVALAGVRQLRVATKKYAAEVGRAPVSLRGGQAMTDVQTGGLRMLDDWDAGDATGPSLELAGDPMRRRR